MRTLSWNPDDVTAYLGTAGEWDEYGTFGAYHLSRGQVQLTLSIRPLESLVQFSIEIGTESPPLVEIGLLVRGEVRLATGYLEFRDVAFLAELTREAILNPCVPQNGGAVDLLLGIRPQLHLLPVYRA